LGIPNGIGSLIQDNTLVRKFYDALFPNLLYRYDCTPEKWEANVGEQQILTRTGLMPVDIAGLIPGKEPTPGSYPTEQWKAQATQFGDTIDTHMPTNYVALASTFVRNTQQLGLNAGQTVNRLARNSMFRAYCSGETNTLGAVGIGAVLVPVSTLNGFTEQLQNGVLSAVSAGNPINISFGGLEPNNTVIGFQAADSTQPFGAGVLTLGSALTVGLAAREVILSQNRAKRRRAGGGSSVDAITAADILTLDDCISAAARLREMNVPPHPDGFYHAQITPTQERQIFQDNAWQRLYQSLPDSVEYNQFIINDQVGLRFYRNTASPNARTVSTLEDDGANARMAPEIGADVVNEAGLPIARMLVTGGGVCYEKWIDESKFISEAGVTGKIGDFSVINNGLQTMTARIRYTLRAPLDRLQQEVSQTWSWSGDFPVPSDQTNGDDARFKRAVVVESVGSE